MTFKEIYSGYISIIKELFFLKNDRSFENLRITNIKDLIIVFIIGGLIGLFRNYLEVKFAINLTVQWYSFDTDIMFTMFFYPIFFTFSAPMLLDLFFNSKISYTKIFSYIFFTQIVHIFIPFIDVIGKKLNFNNFHSLPFMGNIMNSFFYGKIVMTLGIIIAWILVIFSFFRFFNYHNISYKKTFSIFIVFFNFYYWPIYHIWPMLNNIGNRLFNIEKATSYSNVWGYGFYFALLTICGILFFIKKKYSNKSMIFIFSFFITMSSIRAFIDNFHIYIRYQDYIMSFINTLIYIFVLYLCIPTFYSYIYYFFEKEKINNIVLKNIFYKTILIWTLYPFVTGINYIFNFKTFQKIVFFRYIPTFLEIGNFVSPGFVICTIVIIFYYIVIFQKNLNLSIKKNIFYNFILFFLFYLIYYQWSPQWVYKLSETTKNFRIINNTYILFGYYNLFFIFSLNSSAIIFNRIFNINVKNYYLIRNPLIYFSVFLLLRGYLSV
ncbi:MAG: hypothetical protein M0R03_18435 [Novosphingobium sp.]|nr:hypothetical protein [Novosphingobium sp.]